MKVLEDVHRQLEELGQHGRHTYNNEPVEVRSKRQLMVLEAQNSKDHSAWKRSCNLIGQSVFGTSALETCSIFTSNWTIYIPDRTLFKSFRHALTRQALRFNVFITCVFKSERQVTFIRSARRLQADVLGQDVPRSVTSEMAKA